MSLSVDGIVISDRRSRRVVSWSNSRSMIREDGGEFFVRERYSKFNLTHNEDKMNRIVERQTVHCRVGQPVR